MSRLFRRDPVLPERPASDLPAIPRPVNSDWAWRPAPWCVALPSPEIEAPKSATTIDRDLALFHDCVRTAPTLRQLRNPEDGSPAPFALQLEVGQFDGSFLSLVVDLPGSALMDLKRRHVLRAVAIVETTSPVTVFVRANIQHGPNLERIVRELPVGGREPAVEFDLAGTSLSEKRVEKAWIDLIFEKPDANRIVVRDLTISRRPRAAF